MITNGNVKYSRMVRPADFEGKTVEINLAFTLPEGTEDAEAYRLVDGYLDSITGRVHARLGITAAPASGAKEPVGAPATVQKPTRAKSPPVIKSDAEKIAKAVEGGQAVKRAAEAKADDLPPESKPQISTQPENRVGPDDLPPEDTTKTPAVAELDDLDKALQSAAKEAKPLTEKDLVEAATTAVKRGVDPKAIHKLREEFGVSAPKTIQNIPVERRQEWIDKCGSLKGK